MSNMLFRISETLDREKGSAKKTSDWLLLVRECMGNLSFPRMSKNFSEKALEEFGTQRAENWLPIPDHKFFLRFMNYIGLLHLNDRLEERGVPGLRSLRETLGLSSQWNGSLKKGNLNVPQWILALTTPAIGSDRLEIASGYVPTAFFLTMVRQIQLSLRTQFQATEKEKLVGDVQLTKKAFEILCFVHASDDISSAVNDVAYRNCLPELRDETDQSYSEFRDLQLLEDQWGRALRIARMLHKHFSDQARKGNDH